jgi:hypothetical protein
MGGLIENNWTCREPANASSDARTCDSGVLAAVRGQGVQNLNEIVNTEALPPDYRELVYAAVYLAQIERLLMARTLQLVPRWYTQQRRMEVTQSNHRCNRAMPLGLVFREERRFKSCNFLPHLLYRRIGVRPGNEIIPFQWILKSAVDKSID